MFLTQIDYARDLHVSDHIFGDQALSGRVSCTYRHSAARAEQLNLTLHGQYIRIVLACLGPNLLAAQQFHGIAYLAIISHSAVWKI